MSKNPNLFRWIGAGLATIAAIFKASEAKEAKVVSRRQDSHESAPQLREADVLGKFRLGYVDCIPYSGAEQAIFIEPDGAIECFQEETIPGLGDRESGNFKRREFGRLKTGSLLKGEVQPSPKFRSKVEDRRVVSNAKIQLVNMPGGPGVWFAMQADVGGSVATWDEIYVRPTGDLFQEVRS